MRLRPCFLVALVLAASSARAMTPEEAYAAIPHQRTTFDAGVSTLSPTQVDSLKRLFAHSDQGVVLKVRGMQAQRAGDAKELKRIVQSYDVLIENLEAQKLAPEVVRARDRVVKALDLHKRFLASRPEAGLQYARKDLSGTAEVREASGNLIQAYQDLMKAFPREPSRNKSAFYDYLCALDYL